MATLNLLVSFSVVFLAVAVAVFVGQAQGSDLCRKADYVPLCRSVVKGISDPKVALRTTIEHLMFETKRARQASGRLGKKQSLGVCNENFESAIDDLQKSLGYLMRKDKGSLDSSLSAAITYYVTCDDAVEEGGIQKLASGLLSTDTMLRHMASNCLYLSNLVGN